MKRIPRPLGHTQLAQYLNQINQDTSLPEPTKQKQRNFIINKIINHYINNNFQDELTGKQIQINQLADYLNISTIEILKRTNRGLMNIADIYNDKDKVRQVAGVMISWALNLGLQGTQNAAQQVAILKAKQGNKFVPFLSQTLNVAIKNQIDASKPIIDLLKVLTDKPDQNIIYNNQSVTNQNNYLTPDTAMGLINSQQASILTDLGMLNDTLSSLPELPEVDARKQELGDQEIRKLGTHKDALKVAHEDRREHQFGTIIEPIEDADTFIN